MEIKMPTQGFSTNFAPPLSLPLFLFATRKFRSKIRIIIHSMGFGERNARKKLVFVKQR